MPGRTESSLVDKMFKVAPGFGIEIKLDKDGPYITRPTVKITKDVYWKVKEFRLILHRHRREVIERLGGNPDDYSWLPAPGTEERVWYDHIKECSECQHSGTYTGMTGTEWHSKKDALDLLTSCEDSVEWRDKARRFWWDTTHAKSYKEDDYEWPLGD